MQSIIFDSLTILNSCFSESHLPFPYSFSRSFIQKNKKSISNLTNTPSSSSFSLLVLHSRYFLSLIIQDPFSSHLLRIIKIAHTRHKLRQVLMSNFVEGPRTQHNSAYFLSALQRFLLYGQIALFDPYAQHPRNLGRGLFNRKHQREYIASNRFERALQRCGFVPVV